jgi:hypothetical protein
MAFPLNEKRVKDPIEKKKTLPNTETLERYGACDSFELNEMSKVIVQCSYWMGMRTSLMRI